MRIIKTNRQAEVTAEPLYRTDLINAVMGASRLTNAAVAKLAGVGDMTVSRVRNGDPNVTYIILKKIADALGVTMAELADIEGTLVEKR